MATFTYPTSWELEQIAQDKLPRLMKDRPIFDILPVRNYDAALVSFEQGDNYTGLQQIRGLNGQPSRVKRVGMKRYDFTPGVFGEFTEIDEKEITQRRQYGTFGQPINISDLVTMAQDQLLGRELDRIEYIGWTLLVTGTFSVALPYGSQNAATDTYTVGSSGASTVGIYEFQSLTASVGWTTPATSHPLADFRSVQLAGRGHSASFGTQAKAYMNRVTYNAMLANTNANDLAGRRTSGLATVLSPQDLDMVLMAEGLPRVVVYDEGYLDDSGAFQPYIGNGKVVVVGARTDGQAVGEYQMTRNANNPDLSPGSYDKVIDRGETQVPRSIEVHRGHNGGPALRFPGAILILTAY